MTAVQELLDWAAEDPHTRFVRLVGRRAGPARALLHRRWSATACEGDNPEHNGEGATAEEAAQAVLDQVRPLSAAEKVQRWCLATNRTASVTVAPDGRWRCRFDNQNPPWLVDSAEAGWKRLADEIGRA